MQAATNGSRPSQHASQAPLPEAASRPLTAALAGRRTRVDQRSSSLRVQAPVIVGRPDDPRIISAFVREHVENIVGALAGRIDYEINGVAGAIGLPLPIREDEGENVKPHPRFARFVDLRCDASRKSGRAAFDHYHVFYW